ncbi:MAG: hypothetical protein RR703_03250, partial [Bacilli bacterium]
AKYYNKYTTDSMLTACGGGKCLGNSLVETNNWYGDLNYFADASYPWFVRAGLFYDTAGSGLFGFDTDDGSADSPMSFRVAFGFAQ